ncbi:MAG: alpha/beta hydrolase, partial [Candidatus Thorarchaeota archaeon]
KLIREMKNSLMSIKCPAILFQGRLDSQIKVKSIDYIYDNINSKQKKKICLEHSDHPILDIPDHEQIVSHLITFIKEIH